MQTLLHACSDDQHERFLRPLINGQARSCFAMTEPDAAGSDPTNVTTTAVRDGDEWVLNGSKWLDLAAHRATRRRAFGQQLGGHQAVQPSEVHRMVIARELLKLARDGTSTRPACGDLPSSGPAAPRVAWE